VLDYEIFPFEFCTTVRCFCVKLWLICLLSKIIEGRWRRPRVWKGLDQERGWYEWGEPTWVPHGVWPMIPKELRKGITSDLELGFEHGNSRWKALDEQKLTEISERGFEMIEKREILMPHPLKRYLGAWVSYKLVCRCTHSKVLN